MTQRTFNEFIYLIYTILLIGITISIIEFNEQGKPLIIDQNIDIDHQESALSNKASKFGFASVSILMVIISEVTPMTEEDQFIKRVLKYGIPGKEPEYTDDNESQSLVRT